MAGYWFLGGTPENIRRGFEKLLWGFWDPALGVRSGWKIDAFVKAVWGMSRGDLVILGRPGEAHIDVFMIASIDELVYDESETV